MFSLMMSKITTLHYVHTALFIQRSVFTDECGQMLYQQYFLEDVFLFHTRGLPFGSPSPASPSRSRYGRARPKYLSTGACAKAPASARGQVRFTARYSLRHPRLHIAVAAGKALKLWRHVLRAEALQSASTRSAPAKPGSAPKRWHCCTSLA